MRLIHALPFVVAAACGGSPPPAGAPPRAAAGPPCDAPPIDLLAGGADTILVEEPTGLVSDAYPVLSLDSGAHPLGGDDVVAVRCVGDGDGGAMGDCELVVGAPGGEARWSAGVADAATDMPAGDVVTLHAPLAVDVTGDGVAEWVLTWDVLGESMPAVGSQATTWLAIVAVPAAPAAVTTLYGPVATTASGAGGLEACDATVEARVCAARADVTRSRRCQLAICVDAAPDERGELGCTPPEALDERVTWDGAAFR